MGERLWSIASTSWHTKQKQAKAQLIRPAFDSQHALSAPALTCCTQQPCSQLRQLLWQVLLHQQLSSRGLLAQAQRQLQHLQQPIQVGLLRRPSLEILDTQSRAS